MKKKLTPLLLALCTIALTATIVASVVNTYFAIEDHTDYSSTFTHDGHSYVLVHVNGENAITHDPDCPCLNKQSDNK